LLISTAGSLLLKFIIIFFDTQKPQAATFLVLLSFFFPIDFIFSRVCCSSFSSLTYVASYKCSIHIPSPISSKKNEERLEKFILSFIHSPFVYRKKAEEEKKRKENVERISILLLVHTHQNSFDVDFTSSCINVRESKDVKPMAHLTIVTKR